MTSVRGHGPLPWIVGNRWFQEGSNRGPKRGPKMDPFWSSRCSEPGKYGHPFQGVFTPNQLVEMEYTGMDWYTSTLAGMARMDQMGYLGPQMRPLGVVSGGVQIHLTHYVLMEYISRHMEIHVIWDRGPHKGFLCILEKCKYPGESLWRWCSRRVPEGAAASSY